MTRPNFKSNNNLRLKDHHFCYMEAKFGSYITRIISHIETGHNKLNLLSWLLRLHRSRAYGGDRRHRGMLLHPGRSCSGQQHRTRYPHGCQVEGVRHLQCRTSQHFDSCCQRARWCVCFLHYHQSRNISVFLEQQDAWTHSLQLCCQYWWAAYHYVCNNWLPLSEWKMFVPLSSWFYIVFLESCGWRYYHHGN